jgi:hypothetical protein
MESAGPSRNLKMGIEGLLTRMVPGVERVESV